ncbi:inorganic pyrophosphatase [Clostridium sulfidigenes]|uniref:inorganic diphosphatase n=1 Tax=Clostridium sulfidigenes TaxID=318464 RepID=A0A084JIQ6_9CLOT|nr:putative manganese-dependent inorganic diphosphatase [Clostridium sulfidigenes]KEZ88840.1 inorganic pyrophosphatase [Clostridium sulfidigenes]
MVNKVYITGHRNPDSDSICAAIAYSEFKNKTQRINAIPIRLGEISRETQFILDYFGVQPPQLIQTVKPQIIDLKIDTVAPIASDISLKMAWSIMKQKNIKTLPVIYPNEKLAGIVSVSNLAASYLDIWDNYVLAKSKTSLSNILETLSAKIVYLSDENLELKGKVVVSMMEPNDRNLIEAEDICICGDRELVQEFVLDCNARLMIITNNTNPSEKIIDLAKEKGCTIITTPYDSFTAARLIPQSIPIEYVMTKNNLITFSTSDFIEEIKDIMLETRYRSYPVLDEDGSVVGSISRYHLITQQRKKVILVDHNEKTQSVDGLEDADILEIIDHHRIGDIQTGQPIYFRNEPVGSTSTIVANIFFENGIRPSKKVAGLLCGAIISDTLLLKSPTATIVDEIILKRLAEIASIDIEKFAQEMFKAGTSLEGKSSKELLYQDFKIFNMGNFKVGVGQITTTYMDGFTPLINDLKTVMNEKANQGKFDLIILMVTDIFKSSSLFIVCGEHKEVFSRAFNIKLNNGTAYIDQVVSRKKQVIPPLTEVINQIK